MDDSVFKPQRVQLKRSKGWRMPDRTIKVDRSTRWGNPFPVTEERSNAESVRLFSALINRDRHWTVFVRGTRRQVTIDDVKRELAGSNLACWCRPGLACHADILLRVVNPD